jgi:hypothetical protein
MMKPTQPLISFSLGLAVALSGEEIAQRRDSLWRFGPCQIGLNGELLKNHSRDDSEVPSPLHRQIHTSAYQPQGLTKRCSQRQALAT